jgi:hypothetical protein
MKQWLQNNLEHLITILIMFGISKRLKELELDSKISDAQFDFQNETHDKNCEKLCNLILCTAK